jgi:hypothetical protein
MLLTEPGPKNAIDQIVIKSVGVAMVLVFGVLIFQESSISSYSFCI